MGVHLDETRPVPALLLASGLLRFDAYHAATDLDRRLGVGLQVQPPDRMRQGSALGGHDDQVLVVGEVQERARALLAGLAPGGDVMSTP